MNVVLDAADPGVVVMMSRFFSNMKSSLVALWSRTRKPTKAHLGNHYQQCEAMPASMGAFPSRCCRQHHQQSVQLWLRLFYIQVNRKHPHKTKG
jgi:hypothetical protein